MAKWKINIQQPFLGYSPKYYLNSTSSFGNASSAVSMTDIDLTDPNYIKQAHSLTSLTSVPDLLNCIIPEEIITNYTFGVSATKLHKISASAIYTTSPFPHTITDSVTGRSCIEYNGNIYYFYSKSSGGDIGEYDLATTFDDDWGSTEDSALQTATTYPCLEIGSDDNSKLIFGNGRYLGVYDGTTLDVSQYDFGTGSEVVGIATTNNFAIVAVNHVNGKSSIYYINSTLDTTTYVDSAELHGEIGTIFLKDGYIYVFFKKNGNTAYYLSILSGKIIEKYAEYQTAMPKFGQVDIYEDFLAFNGGNKIHLFGKNYQNNPYSHSQIVSGKYSTLGAISTPFDEFMIASTQSTSYDIGKIGTSYGVTSDWKSIYMDVSDIDKLSRIDSVMVKTNNLGENAKCDITLAYNNGRTTKTVGTVTGENKTRHIFTVGSADIENLQVRISWSNSNTTNPCHIKEVVITGEYYGRR